MTVAVDAAILHKRRFRIPQYDPKRLGLRVTNLKGEGKSEYQSAYSNWPFQPPRTCIRPESNQIDIPAEMEMKTTYGTDFLRHEIQKIQKKKEETYIPPKGETFKETTYRVDFGPKKVEFKSEPFKFQQVYLKPTTKFRGKSCYQVSYVSFDPDLVKSCRPQPIKPPECIYSAREKDTKFTGESTFRNDYQKHQVQEKRKPIIPSENALSSKEPLDTTTMYQQYYTRKSLPAKRSKVVVTKPIPEMTNAKSPSVKDIPSSEETVKVGDSQENAASPVNSVPDTLKTTFMVDFPAHHNIKRRTSCKPPESDHQFTDAPFDGKTTQSEAYQKWPVAAPEKPLWAIKPDYKRPQNGMNLNSTYMVDFKKPTSVGRPPSPVRHEANENIIKHNMAGDAMCKTTYQANFLGQKPSEPTKSFMVKQVYEPPKEMMVCQSTQRAHYRGEQVKRAAICRQTSEHRSLLHGKTMNFVTTYRDTFKENRPKSCPASCFSNRKGASSSAAVSAAMTTSIVQSVTPKPEVRPVSSNSMEGTKDSGIGTMEEPLTDNGGTN